MPLNDDHFVTGWRLRATVAEVLAVRGAEERADGFTPDAFRDFVTHGD